MLDRRSVFRTALVDIPSLSGFKVVLMGDVVLTWRVHGDVADLETVYNLRCRTYVLSRSQRHYPS